MTYRDMMLKRLRRKYKVWKRDPERSASIRGCIQELELRQPTESRVSIHALLQKHHVDTLIGGLHD